jgi:hypothetical protein
MIVQVVDFFRRTEVSAHAAAIGSIKLGSLFLTLPTRALTGQQIMCDLHPTRAGRISTGEIR